MHTKACAPDIDHVVHTGSGVQTCHVNVKDMINLVHNFYQKYTAADMQTHKCVVGPSPYDVR